MDQTTVFSVLLQAQLSYGLKESQDFLFLVISLVSALMDTLK